MSAIQQAFLAVGLKGGIACPYCSQKAELVRGAAIYPHRPDLHQQRFWLCARCDAYVGCHKPNRRLGLDGTEPLGRLANAELRRAKSAAHGCFDWIWRDRHKTRSEAYAWLASKLGIPFERCHIGEFDVPMCRRVVEVCEGFRKSMLVTFQK